MNREIKFRAWDKENAGMIYPKKKNNKNTSGIVTIDAWCDSENDIVSLMQYTGLKDKHGKEIYEGDIVDWNNERYTIVYDQEMAQFNHRPVDSDGHDDYFELENNKQQKVIGNIHENPELLEKQANGRNRRI